MQTPVVRESPARPLGERPVTLEAIYDRYAKDLLAYARLLSRSLAEAEDALQEVFVRLAGRMDRLEEILDLRG